MRECLITIVLGCALGILTGFFGAGGGFILTPALNLFLGMDMVQAIGTGAAQICGASSLVMIQRFDRHFTGLEVAAWCMAGIFPGCWLGARVVLWLDGKGRAMANGALLGFFALLLAGIAISMFREPRKKAEEESRGLFQGVRLPPYCRSATLPGGKISAPVLVALGVMMGFLSGLLGMGGGVVMLPALLYLVGQNGKYATLTTTMLVFASSAVSSVFHFLDGHVLVKTLVWLLAGSVAGTRIGVFLQRRCATAELKRKFAWVVAAAWLMVVVKLVGEIWT